MPVRSCRVVVEDMDGVSHRGARTRRDPPQGMGCQNRPKVLNLVKVSVAEVRVKHELKLQDFAKWLRPASKKCRVFRKRVREEFDRLVCDNCVLDKFNFPNC